MSVCAKFLTAMRAVAKKENGWTDRACAVLDQGGGSYAVEDYAGKIVWQGSAHCRYCARTEAIGKMADKE